MWFTGSCVCVCVRVCLSLCICTLVKLSLFLLWSSMKKWFHFSDPTHALRLEAMAEFLQVFFNCMECVYDVFPISGCSDILNMWVPDILGDGVWSFLGCYQIVGHVGTPSVLEPMCVHALRSMCLVLSWERMVCSHLFNVFMTSVAFFFWGGGSCMKFSWGRCLTLQKQTNKQNWGYRQSASVVSVGHLMLLTHTKCVSSHSGHNQTWSTLCFSNHPKSDDKSHFSIINLILFNKRKATLM